MSDIVITVHCDDHVQRRAPAEDQKRKKKNKRFRKRMQDLERKGRWEGRRKRRAGQSTQNRAPPQQNGAPSPQPSHPASTHNTSLPRPSSTAGASSCASSCASMPSTSTGGTPSFTVTVNKKSTQTSAGIPTKYLAMDCEMVGTGPKGSISQLARCSLVSYEGDVVYDKFIRPAMPVTDYRTRWSGIRRSDLVNAVPFSDARKEILRLLAGKVVIGHAVHNDFKVLSYSHPAALTRDTSRIPLLNVKAGFAVHECASLKRLTKAIFNRDIQTGKRGHSSVEDARATLELYKVVEQDWERELASKSQPT